MDMFGRSLYSAAIYHLLWLTAMEMKIEKIINNNIVSSRDHQGNELIVMGRGLGFGRKPGQTVDEKKVEKIFRLDNKDSLERFKELLKRLPIEYLRVSDEIISYAKNALGKELSANVYLTLTDHISFAISRHKNEMEFQNPLFEEIKIFYPNEYAVGCHAVYLIEKKTGVMLSEDEAASIALHFVNAELNSAIGKTFTLTQMIREMMDIVEEEIPAFREARNRDRLVINFKHLLYRMIAEEQVHGREDAVLFSFIKDHCSKEYELIGRVDAYIQEKYQYSMNEEEKIYLTLNIKRIRDLYVL